MNVLRSFFVFILLPILSFAQFVPIPITNVDRYFLSELTKDTTSDLIKHVGHNFSFGIGDKRNFNPIIIKSKKNIYFLIEGTNRIYQLIKDSARENELKIIRLDSTFFFGDNFTMMAFYRKDTIFQYGGYGFWQNRDFFSFYRPLTHDWDFYSNGEGLQSTYCMNYYDRKEDKFYLLGRFHQNSHINPRPEFRDSVYMYDFKIGKWTTLGKVAMNIFNQATLDPSSFWSNDKGQYFFRYNDIFYIDAAKNQIFSLKKNYFDRLQSAIRKNNLTSNILNFYVALGDSLLIITGEPNNFVANKIKLTNDYFDQSNPKPLYEPAGLNFTNLITLRLSTYELSAYVLFNIVIIISILYFIKKKYKKSQKSHSVTDHTNPSFIPHFINQLNQSEKELLKEFVRSSLKGKKLDIHTVNKILGVQNKQSMIQKTRRSLTITRINDLYMNLSGSNTALIKRAKDEQDKRIYNYYIPVKEAIEFDKFFMEK